MAKTTSNVVNASLGRVKSNHLSNLNRKRRVSAESVIKATDSAAKAPKIQRVGHGDKLNMKTSMHRSSVKPLQAWRIPSIKQNAGSCVDGVARKNTKKSAYEIRVSEANSAPKKAGNVERHRAVKSAAEATQKLAINTKSSTHKRKRKTDQWSSTASNKQVDSTDTAYFPVANTNTVNVDKDDRVLLAHAAHANTNFSKQDDVPLGICQQTSNPEVMRLVVDMLSLTFDVPLADSDELLDRASDFSKSYDGHAYLHRLASTSRSYKYSFVIRSATGSHLGFLEFHPSNRKANFARLEFNPTTIGKRGTAEVLRLIRGIFGQNYRRYFAEGNITRLDLSVDIVKLAACDVLMFGNRYRTSSVWGRSWNQDGMESWATETVCIGAPVSDYVAKVYDKTVQMWKVKGVTTDELVTRIEVSICPRGEDGHSIKMKDLGDIKNPFAALSVAYYPAPEDDDPWFVFFVHACHRIGPEEALRRIKNKSKRSLYRNKLASHVFDWWQPEALWEKLQRKLMSIEVFMTKGKAKH